LDLSSRRYRSSLAGDRPLVPVSEPTSGFVSQTFRAQNDSTWTRYEVMFPEYLFAWRAYQTDGTTLYFGDVDHVSNCWAEATFAPLTWEIDRFGNAVEYLYVATPENECRIDHITYGQNSAAGLQSFATVQFQFTDIPSNPDCPAGMPPIGSKRDWRV